MATAVALPPGFELENAPQSAALPPGFELEHHTAPEIPSKFNLAMQAIGQIPSPIALPAKLMASLTDNEPLESKAVRATQGAIDPAIGIAQLVPHTISAVSSVGGMFPNSVSNAADKLAAQQDSFAQKENAGYEQMRGADGMSGFDGYRMAGNIASPVNLMAARLAGKLAPAATLGKKAVQGATIGAMYGAESPATNPDESYAQQKATQMALGAAMGGAAPIAGEGIARVVNPKVSPEAQTLLDKGVRLTMGQIMGGSLKNLEDAATSVPFLGNMINRARTTGIKDLNVAVGNEALAPLGMKVPDGVEAGNALLKEVRTSLGKKYDAIVPQLTGTVDTQFTSELENLRNMAQEMPPAQRDQFNNIIDQQVMKKISPNGSFTGESYKEMESALGEKASGYSGDSDFDKRNLGAAIGEVKNSLQGLLQRSNPDHAETLGNINAGYANYARMRDAAAGIGAKDGVFTPAQLQGAVKRGDKTVGDRAFSEGDALLQDVSAPAKAIMPSTMPDSGSIGRALLTAAVMRPDLAAAALATSPLYSQPAQMLARALIAGRQGPVWENAANTIRKITSPADLARLLGGALSGGPSAPGSAVAAP
jgi:hypothetical protein